MKPAPHLIGVVLLLLLSLPGFTAADEEEIPPLKLPLPVWHRVSRGGEGEFILKVHYPQMAGLPELEFSKREQEFFSTIRIPILRNLINANSALAPLSDSLLEVWDPGNNGILYGHCSLSTEDIISTYRSEGWLLLNEESDPYLQPPLNEKDRERIRSIMESNRRAKEELAAEIEELRRKADEGDTSAEESLEMMTEMNLDMPDEDKDEKRYRKMIMEEKWKILPGPEGSLAIISPYTNPEHFELVEAPENLRDVLERFPFSTLFDPDREDLFLAAILFTPEVEEDIDEDAGKEQEDSSGDRQAVIREEIREINREIAQLSGEGLEAAVARTGNMLLAVNQIDGGFDLDLDAEIPGNPDESLTTGIIQAGLTFLQMTVIEHSPGLARELFDVAFSSSEGLVSARTRLSHDALLDYLETRAEKWKRMQELFKREEELFRELAELEESRPPEQEITNDK